MVVQADDVAGVGLVDVLAVRGHERNRVADAHFAPHARVVHAHTGLIFTRANAYERDAVAVRRVHVRLDLEHETRERVLFRRDRSRFGRARLRRRCEVYERIEQLAHTIVVNRRAEEHRCLLAGEIQAELEWLGRAAHELELLAQRAHPVHADRRGQLRRSDTVNLAHVGEPAAVAVLIEERAVLGEMVNASELATHSDRPGHRRALDVEHALDVVEQIDGLAAVAVELVHETDDRRRA